MTADLLQKLGNYFHDVFIVNFDAWVVLGFVIPHDDRWRAPGERIGKIPSRNTGLSWLDR